MSRLITAFDLIAALALSVLLAVVAGSISTRLLFDLTGGRINLLFEGAIELATYALLVTVFAALPRAMRGGLVNVDLFTGAWPAALNRGLDRLWLMLFALFAAVLAWRYGLQTLASLRRGDTTQDLQLPLYGFFGYASIACFGLAVVAAGIALSRRPVAPVASSIETLAEDRESGA